jgi:transcriptional regulator with XRE-family HTH domain
VDTSIGRRVAEARERKRLSQAQLALEVGVRQQTVAAWETGRNIPPTEKLGRLSAVLGLSIDYLVLGEEGQGDDMKRIHRLRHALDVLEDALTDEGRGQGQEPA